MRSCVDMFVSVRAHFTHSLWFSVNWHNKSVFSMADEYVEYLCKPLRAPEKTRTSDKTVMLNSVTETAAYAVISYANETSPRFRSMTGNYACSQLYSRFSCAASLFSDSNIGSSVTVIFSGTVATFNT